ncbi:hypothetical protein Acaty_c1420 [Acidithiobacillus caldus ATCC 51756]|uniref:Uncharacterized protein n=1 Tax=Acidithiobacillus caldus (strain ATCC 51756 / DSM 8584 / KU) TaxID=637389 RepID=A0A059ZZ71_ACICK|nr:hypothetical protein Acaty_c1420 [Acidithiobacillus caldus ATCC 51756]QER45804.1 hypothetical protein F0726_02752 [Acidithiobacillus caldus]
MQPGLFKRVVWSTQRLDLQLTSVAGTGVHVTYSGTLQKGILSL